jgi:hypothetical protein
VTALTIEVEEETAGDSMSEKKWVRRSLRKLSQALKDNGFTVSSMTVRRLLHEAGYSLKANRKENAKGHPERDRQFRYMKRVKGLFREAGHPIISSYYLARNLPTIFGRKTNGKRNL